MTYAIWVKAALLLDGKSHSAIPETCTQTRAVVISCTGILSPQHPLFTKVGTLFSHEPSADAK